MGSIKKSSGSRLKGSTDSSLRWIRKYLRPFRMYGPFWISVPIWNALSLHLSFSNLFGRSLQLLDRHHNFRRRRDEVCDGTLNALRLVKVNGRHGSNTLYGGFEFQCEEKALRKRESDKAKPRVIVGHLSARRSGRSAVRRLARTGKATGPGKPRTAGLPKQLMGTGFPWLSIDGDPVFVS